MRQKITNLLVNTQRQGMEELLNYMEKEGFFDAPCSGKHHYCYKGGLAKHSVNVYDTIVKLNKALNGGFNDETLVVVSILHDLGKMGDFGKPNYVPKYLKSGELASTPYQTNPNLLYEPHEVRSISIARRFIRLTEDEEFAILYHNGLYGDFKYVIQGKETPLYMLLHTADLWASRVIEGE